MECIKLLSLGSDKPGKQTVHGLKCHLEKAHKELFAEYTTKLNASKEPPAKKPKLDEHSTVQPKFIQFSLPNLSERSTKWPDDHLAVQRIDKAIMDLIIVDMLPYTIIEGDAFKHLNFADKAATRRYEPKSREQLFSAAGQIYSDRRSNLLGENADKLLFLSYNIRLFNYDY